MNDQFGDAGDPSIEQQSFEKPEGDKPSSSEETGITPDELIALQKRDENAQTHIPQLESEMKELRTLNADLAARLDSATTLDDVVDRIKSERSPDGQPVDAGSVVEQVEKRLATKARELLENENWASVVSTLTERYGSWKAADVEIQARAIELNMDLDEATRLARQAPQAFTKLFDSTGSAAPQQGIASASNNETSNTSPTKDMDRDAMRLHYNTMRRENPAKFKKLKTQKQMWHDLYSD
jgi:predicted  nucleic acid-binding Zn-ribbon protein